MELDRYLVCGYACMEICGHAGIIRNGVRTSRISQWVEERKQGERIILQPAVEKNKKNGVILWTWKQPEHPGGIPKWTNSSGIQSSRLNVNWGIMIDCVGIFCGDAGDLRSWIEEPYR